MLSLLWRMMTGTKAVFSHHLFAAIKAGISKYKHLIRSATKLLINCAAEGVK